MRKLRIALVIAALTLASPAASLELPAVGCAQAQTLASDLDLYLPEAALSDILSPHKGLDPVIITVPGLSFGEIGGFLEVKHFRKLLQLLLPKKPINDEELVNAFTTFNTKYFLLENEDDALALLTSAQPARLPDNYLELKLRQIPGFDDHDVIIAPFPWSRDPEDSEITVPRLADKIIEIHDQYKHTGRPLHILAYSWGSVLTHTALHRVTRVRPDISIDKLITAGSPLMPSNFIVELFLNLEISKEHLEKAVSKPASIKVWRNLWARRDVYSNEISAADSNHQTDAAVERVEPALIDLILHNKPLRKDAKRDLYKIRSIVDWHSAYFRDFRATLKSIEKEIYVDIFNAQLAPETVNFTPLH